MPAPAAAPGPQAPQPPSVQAAQALVQGLVDQGVRHVVLAPGSRSAPLVPALLAAEAAGRLRLRVVLDERSAAFTALGMARAELQHNRRRAAAVVTTSGTAVANLHPAVAEADAAGIPLLVISADRPHELVGTGANQTTEQTRIFGDALRAHVDLPADLLQDLGPQAGSRALAGQVHRALAAACGTLSNDPGPAQVNIRFRPPLAPTPDAGGRAPASAVGAPAPVPAPDADGRVPASAVTGLAHSQQPAQALAASAATVPGPLMPSCPGPDVPPHPTPAPVPLVPSCPGLAASRHPAHPTPPDGAPRRGLVIAGDSVDATGTHARALAEHLGWPLLAEPSSGARAGANALTRYAELLNHASGAALAAQAEHLVVFGHPSLTRPVSALLARNDLPIDVVTSTARWTDVAGTASRVLPTALLSGHQPPTDAAQAGAAQVAAALGLGPAPADWLPSWQQAVAELPPLPEPPAASRLSADAVATAVWDAACADLTAPGDAPRPRLVLGSSMTIRRLDRLAVPPAGVAPHPLANRGLAGIDGTLATAVGVAVASGGPVRVLLGDLSFLHDAMSLNRGVLEQQVDLQVVVLDDAGGAIFSSLEYPAVTPAADFARCFTTPQATDIAALGRALGAVVHQPATTEELRELLSRPIEGLSLLYIRL
ncbi:2-succinyl-5-enolpyruvyl-6-hydroxy-3-cyclohexene-1-carboxylic-acid synthase [Actinomyces weissii]|uniref:2-succinyl-5-enolpyruvyl-6-hydroxy-3-cyclohexene-1-carboxylate synthase n=1 Tax=Actinomyces weissii TaxID=675090 RepID=A0A7T7MBI9_9ACTO|nr:2-succinyl-5-enolpyruvyl-6-hydroxy-3-cyclohexene-1-carboxylic-acid synthase [Actinomyces weissii]